jgi:translation initiation factor IF-1
MGKDYKNIQVKGEVKEALPNTMFKVELEDGRIILATLKGIMRRRYVRIFPGDTVKVEMTPYDTERGRIIYKLNN